MSAAAEADPASAVADWVGGLTEAALLFRVAGAASR